MANNNSSSTKKWVTHHFKIDGVMVIDKVTGISSSVPINVTVDFPGGASSSDVKEMVSYLCSGMTQSKKFILVKPNSK
jgi:hypothetical protein